MKKFEEELFSEVPCKFGLSTEGEYKQSILVKHFGDWVSPEDHQFKVGEVQDDLSCANEEIERLNAKLEKQQPEIPEFVAEYIKSTADPIHEMCAWSEHYGDNGGKCDDPELSKMLDWFGMNRNLFYKAVINGYTVAKEKRYEVVFLEDDTTRQILMENNAGYYFIEEESENYGYWKQDFTEMEIKEINEKFWQLSVPVKDEQIEVEE